MKNLTELKTQTRIMWTTEKLQREGITQFLAWGKSMSPFIREGDLVEVVPYYPTLFHSYGVATDSHPTDLGAHSDRQTGVHPFLRTLSPSLDPEGSRDENPEGQDEVASFLRTLSPQDKVAPSGKDERAEEDERVGCPRGQTKVWTPNRSNPRVGDIILARAARSVSGLVMHRVIKKLSKNGRTVLVTQGDAAVSPDPPVYLEDVLGKVVSVERSTARTGCGRNVIKIRLDRGLYHGLGICLARFAFLTRWFNRSIARRYLGAILRRVGLFNS